MRYLGGKSKIAKRISNAILSHTNHRHRLIEPFVGGGAITAVLAPNFDQVIASDIHEDLILLWQAVKDGWPPPTEITEHLYQELKTAQPCPLRGFAGFGGASWGGKWFGGYARGGGRNYADESARSLLRDVKRMGNVTFSHTDYRDIIPGVNDVIYADPPYKGTTGYESPFDSDEFFATMEEWVEAGAIVFVSEYSAPRYWTPILEITRTRDMKSKLVNAESVTEKLFVFDPNLTLTDSHETGRLKAEDPLSSMESAV